MSAYVLCFGGLLLLAGRLADIVGRRRLFLGALALFVVGSLLCGVATSKGLLIAGRAVQGVGAAGASPAALAIISAQYEGLGESRRRALGWWSAAAPAGGATGLVLGGVLTQAFGWRAAFLVNLAIGPLIAAGVLRSVVPSAAAGRGQRLDVVGPLSLTTAVFALVWGVGRAQSDGFGSAGSSVALTAVPVLLAAFVLAERRSASPMIPLSTFRVPGLMLGAASALALTATTSPMGFLVSQHLQFVAGFSPLRAGIAYLPVLLAVAGGALLGPRLVRRAGDATLLLAFMTIGLGVGWLAVRLGDKHGYAGTVLPAGIAYGAGLGFGSVASTIAGTSSARADNQGLVSGILNSAAPIGTALGLALLVNVSAGHGSSVGATGAFETGLRTAFAIDAVIAASVVVLLVATWRLTRRRHRQPERVKPSV